MSETWKSFRVAAKEGGWEPASYNFLGEDGQEYGSWRRVLRQHSHDVTVISLQGAAGQSPEDHRQGIGAG